jgi:hypothetical protein
VLDRGIPARYMQVTFRAGDVTPETGTVARWQSGDAADCKSVYVGSIPTRASNFPKFKVTISLTRIIHHRSGKGDLLSIVQFQVSEFPCCQASMVRLGSGFGVARAGFWVRAHCPALR